MIWPLGVICLIHNVQSSLPAIAEVMARTRWCMGEGAHCPVNLPFDFPSCCKPFTCTVVPKTHKPTMFLKFTEYKDYRCLLPPKNASFDPEVFNKSDQIRTTFKPKSKEYGNNTLVKLLKALKIENNNVSVRSESSEDINNKSVEIISKEDNSVVNNQYDSLSLNNSESDESKTSINSQSGERDVDSSEIRVTHVRKRSAVNKKSNRSKTRSSFETHSSTAEVADMSQLSKEKYSNEVDYFNVSSQSESNEMPVLGEGERGTQNSLALNSSASYNDLYENETVSLVSDVSNILGQFDDIKTSKSNNLFRGENNTSLQPSDSSSLLTKELSNTSSTEASEEDWHSSQMHVDNRPFLRKAVTIPPFSLSKNVKTIKLNESLETSGE